MRPLSPGDFIGRWIGLIGPAADKLGPPTHPLGDYVEKLALESVKQSLANLRTFPCVRTLEERGRLKLHGAYFGVATGRLLALDETTGGFEPVARGAFGPPSTTRRVSERVHALATPGENLSLTHRRAPSRRG